MTNLTLVVVGREQFPQCMLLLVDDNVQLGDSYTDLEGLWQSLGRAMG